MVASFDLIADCRSLGALEWFCRHGSFCDTNRVGTGIGARKCHGTFDYDLAYSIQIFPPAAARPVRHLPCAERFRNLRAGSRALCLDAVARAVVVLDTEASEQGGRYWYRVRAFGNGQDTAYCPKIGASTAGFVQAGRTGGSGGSVQSASVQEMTEPTQPWTAVYDVVDDMFGQNHPPVSSSWSPFKPFFQSFEGDQTVSLSLQGLPRHTYAQMNLTIHASGWAGMDMDSQLSINIDGTSGANASDMGIIHLRA